MKTNLDLLILGYINANHFFVIYSKNNYGDLNESFNSNDSEESERTNYKLLNNIEKINSIIYQS